jgi:iron complex outermembrane recepter protein
MKNSRSYAVSAVAVIIAGSLFSTPSVAQSASGASNDEPATIIVTGTRRSDRSSANTAAPVDVVSGTELTQQATPDLANAVRTVVPSFNVNTQAISDAATIVRPANLRGLAPDHTLVLVNGKRRHRSAVIAFIGGGISNGSQGVDLSSITSIGVKQVEVLRDGASAQYGSDAVAGVMNFILNDSADALQLTAGYGSTYEGDGANLSFGANVGAPLGDSGFVNISAEWRESDATSRSVQRGDAAALRAAGNTAVANPAQVWGQPDVRGDLRIWLNSGIDLGDDYRIYAFGGYATREAEGGFYYRNPNTRGGVYSNDDGVTRLVGDLTPGTTPCPTITIGAANEATLLANVRNDPNCFVFNELFPGGFTPKFGGTLDSMSAVFGTSGAFAGVSYDVSYGFGREEVDFVIRNTINPSLGPNSPTTFNPGANIQTETNFNIDLSYEAEIGLASPLNIAGGFELRSEEFELVAGDAASWQVGPLASQGFGLGSNGFQGFRPSAAGNWERKNTAFYIDLEADVTDALTLGAAVRTEDFDTFGRTTNYKVSGLLRATDALTLRGTYSTGFRAPTPGQANVINTTTILIGGVLNNRGTVPPESVLGRLIGGRPLDPETANNLSFGGALKIAGVTVTLDFFNIDMEDRITQASGRSVTQAQINALTAADRAQLDALNVTLNGQLVADTTNFTFFTNDFNTQTQGLDLVVTYPFEAFGGRSNLAFLYNHTKTEVDRATRLLDATTIKQIEEGLPHDRGSVTWTHRQGPINLLARANYYGGYYEAHADDGTLPIFPSAEFTLDVEASYEVMDGLRFAIGAENLLDEYPDANPWADILGAKYPVTSPMGFAGGTYYARVSFRR